MTKEEQKQQATTILSQLGGKRFIAMTGSKDFVYDEKGLTFKIIRNALKAEWCTINVNGLDLYDMIFRKLVNNQIVILREVNNLYCDQIESIFSNVTGLATRF